MKRSASASSIRPALAMWPSVSLVFLWSLVLRFMVSASLVGVAVVMTSSTTRPSVRVGERTPGVCAHGDTGLTSAGAGVKPVGVQMHGSPAGFAGDSLQAWFRLLGWWVGRVVR